MTFVVPFSAHVCKQDYTFKGLLSFPYSFFSVRIMDNLVHLFNNVVLQTTDCQTGMACAEFL